MQKGLLFSGFFVLDWDRYEFSGQGPRTFPAKRSGFHELVVLGFHR
jgi:hypothetical protein